jgi:hypothetical protein
MRLAARQLQCHSARCVQRALEESPALGLNTVQVVPDGNGLSLCGAVDTPEEREQVLAFVRGLTPLRVRSLLAVSAAVTSAAGNR